MATDRKPKADPNPVTEQKKVAAAGEKAASPGQGKDAAKPDAPKMTSATQDGLLPPKENAENAPSGTGGNEAQNGPTDTVGPGTGTPAPPESSYRMPSAIVSDPEGAPLAPPTDTPTQLDPPQGYNLSSTDHVYAEAGGRTVAGEDFIRLVDGDGKDVQAGDLFEDGGASKTFVLSKARVYEEFFYPNTTEKAHRLLWAAGARVPRARAERIKAALDVAPEPAAVARTRQ